MAGSRSSGKFGKNTWRWFSVEGEEMGTGCSPNSTCGPSWWVPRGQGIWSRGAPPFGPWWPFGLPLLAAGPSGKITNTHIFSEIFQENFLKRIFQSSYSGISGLLK